MPRHRASIGEFVDRNEMPSFTYRLRFLISRDRLRHTSRDEPQLIDQPTGDPIELRIEQGTGARPDNLVLIQRGIATADQAREQAEATKYALMRTGLITNVPMLFGKNESGTGLSPSLVDRVREASGSTPRSDVHGIDIIDEADGPTTAIRFEAEGRTTTHIGRFLGELAASLDRNWRGSAASDQLGLAVEVFMAAATERTPRTRFLDFVTVLEILAEPGPRSPAAIAIVDQALAKLATRGADLEENEANSLRSALAQLRTRAIGQSIKDLAIGLDAAQIDGFDEDDIGRFLGRCYTVRSQLVHDGVAPEAHDVAQMAGSLFFLLTHLLVRRIDELSGI